ncbi:MAG: sulfatase-like hydrolase/transferase, partial [Rickettsiaceae bacterium]
MIIIAILWFVLQQNEISPQIKTEIKASSYGKKGRSVILITVDTTRPDRLEPYGATQVSTPALQNLANRGIVFENAWAVAPITLVSHASILSGLYPFEHGVRNNGTQYVEDSVTTLAEKLKDNGYRTSAFVSAAVLDRRYGLNQGFEIYDDDLSDRRNLSPRMVADRTA